MYIYRFNKDIMDQDPCLKMNINDLKNGNIAVCTVARDVISNSDDLKYQSPIVKIRLVHWYVFVDCVVCVRGGSGKNVLYVTQQGI